MLYRKIENLFVY
uniref:Uncharacterized protein n=1 Tax=Anguilla anguilla TaxID=7936 RepID=A0A0E9XG84_ANGAN